MRYGALLSEAVSNAGRLAVLALVPIASSLARWGDVVALARRSGTNVGVKFGLPHPLADLWTFVDAPAPRGDGLHVDAPMAVEGGLTAAVVTVAVAYVVVTGLLMAGYVGSVDQFLRRGRFDFLENVRSYGARMIGFQAVVFGLLLVLVAGAVLDPAVLVVGLLVGFLAWFLFFLAPFLVVVEDEALVDALRRSPGLATSGGEPIGFVLIYGVLVVAGSLPVSVLANGGLPGVLLGVLFSGGFGLVLTVFSVLFVREFLGRPHAATGSTGGPGPVTPTGGTGPIEAASGPDAPAAED